MFDRYTEPARLSLFYARLAVTEEGGTALEPEHHDIQPEHLLLSCLTVARASGPAHMIEQAGASSLRVREYLTSVHR